MKRQERKFSVGGKKYDIYTPEGFEALKGLWTRSNWANKFSYEFTWRGIPVIQLPEDLLIMQELIYKVRPDWIIETGTAHGGSAVFYASMLELQGRGCVISIDVEIRKYNRLAINAHPMSKRIRLIEASSISPSTVRKVKSFIQPGQTVLVSLDSNHTRKHVMAELNLYSKLVSPGSYIVVFDGIMDQVYDAPIGKPGWRNDNPVLAVKRFLKTHRDFEEDPYYTRLGVTYCPHGFLRRKAGSGKTRR